MGCVHHGAQKDTVAHNPVQSLKERKNGFN